MADNFNVNTTQDQSLIAGALNTDNPAMTLVDFATQITRNSQEQRRQEEMIAQAIETSKQSKMSTKNKQEAMDEGVNPELENYLTKDQAIAFLMHEWGVEETDPEIMKLKEVLPNQVNRYTVQTLLRKRSQGMGKAIGSPFKAEAKGMYYGTLDKTGDPVQLEEGQTYQAYVTEDGKINYVPSGMGNQGGAGGNTFKPIGLTKSGETVSPTRSGMLQVSGPDGQIRPYDPAMDGELQPFIAPTLPNAQLGSIENLQNSVEQLNRAKELFNPGVVGPVQDRLMQLSMVSGVDFNQLLSGSKGVTADNVAFRVALNTLVNSYIHEVSGAAVTTQEAARLAKALPSTGNAEEAFMPALEEANRIIEAKLENKLEILRAQGYRNIPAIKATLDKRTAKSEASAEKKDGGVDLKAKLREKLNAMAKPKGK